MKMILMLTLFVVLLFSCNQRRAKAAAEYRFLDSISCDSCMHLLVIRSNLDANLKNKEIIKDGVNDSNLLIKIYHETQPEPGATFDAADGWVQIDLRTRTLYKVNSEKETRTKLKYDQHILDHFIDSCIDKNDWQ